MGSAEGETQAAGHDHHLIKLVSIRSETEAAHGACIIPI